MCVGRCVSYRLFEWVCLWVIWLLSLDSQPPSSSIDGEGVIVIVKSMEECVRRSS